MRNAALAVEVSQVVRTYESGNTAVHALGGVSLALEPGSFTAIMGPSGSGKSTLLNCMAGLDRPTSGSVAIGGEVISTMNDKRLTRFRRARLGFIFQNSNLMPQLTARQNVELPLALAGRDMDTTDLYRILHRVGIVDRANHFPNQLSGGQQQRVAIARALAAHPAIIFADEPTAALDSKTSNEVLSLMHETVAVDGQTIAMVTHDPAVASYADRVLFLADGHIAGELQTPTIDTITASMTRFTAPRE